MINNNFKIPDFLLKLKKLVDSSSTDKLIKWNKDGRSFIIYDGHKLAKDYFPLLFKHKNVFSFIRQLNMYGFHKLNRIGFSTNKNNLEESEWSHPFFVKNRVDLLNKIQRKSTNSMELTLTAVKSVSHDSDDILDETDDIKPLNYELNKLKSAYQQLKSRDQTRNIKILELQRRNEAIRDELTNFRFMIEKQSNWINELSKSLSTFMSNPDLLKNTIIYQKSTKRNILPLTLENFRIDEISNESDLDINITNQYSNEVEIMTTPDHEANFVDNNPTVNDNTNNYSNSQRQIMPLSLSRSNLLSNSCTTSDFEIEELLNYTDDILQES